MTNWRGAAPRSNNTRNDSIQGYSNDCLWTARGPTVTATTATFGPRAVLVRT